MMILAAPQVAALRFMANEPLRVDPFSSVTNVEEVAAMLDDLAKIGLCRRTLQGLNRIYAITPAGLEALAEAERTQTKLSAA
jgi:predicted transcriptional regulator